jgi:GATA-binding protein
MCCALRQYPVTDFMSDHPFSVMSNRRSSSPHQRREDLFPLRTTLPSREPSKEDIELAQRLLGHSQAARNKQQNQNEQTTKDSPSPTYELQSAGSKSPSSERMHQFTPRSLSVERSQREPSQSYSSVTSPPPDSTPSGQVCR